VKYKSLFKYIAIMFVAALVLTGCQDSGANNENVGNTGEESAIADAEQYFNSLIDENADNYQAVGDGLGDNDVSDGSSADGENSDAQTDIVEPDSNSNSESNTQDADNAIEVESLNKDNGYMQIIPVGETCYVDLNNDGKKDLITYNATTSTIEEYGTAVDTFTINGGDYKYTLFLSDQGIHIQDPDLDWYYITDINTRDSYKEIAILDHGANGVPYTYFIRFVGSGTYCLGYVPYFPDDTCFEIKGDGSIESAYDLQLLPNWQAPATWLSGSNQLLSSNLQMRDPDLYYLYEDQYVGDLTQLVDLQLYPSRSLSGTTTEAKVSDSTVTVTFTQTDDEHWVYMKRSDEVEGWIYFENKDTIVSGGKKYNRRDVFKD